MIDLNQNELRQKGSLLSWFLFSGGFLIAAFSGIDQSFFWLPFLISIIVIGLPHGAADWILLRPTSRANGVSKFAVYSLVGALIFAAAIFYPVAVLIGFLFLTIIHFGLADERDLRRLQRTPFLSPIVRASGVFRIAIFFALVCLSDADGVINLISRITALLPMSEAVVLSENQFIHFSTILLFLGASGWVFSLGYQISRRLQVGDRVHRGRRLEVELAEGALLLGAAWVLHPVFSVGLYFLTWHALRHCVLLTDRIPQTRSVNRELGTKLLIVHALSYPLYLPVIPLMAALIAAKGNLTSPFDWVAALLIVCIIFTFPHHYIVEKLLNGKNPRREISIDPVVAVPDLAGDRLPRTP